MGENKHKFQKLTPVDSVDLALYEDALDFIFDNPDIRNVAISGAYGVGLQKGARQSVSPKLFRALR